MDLVILYDGNVAVIDDDLMTRRRPPNGVFHAPAKYVAEK
jgi:hypothetical protein